MNSLNGDTGQNSKSPRQYKSEVNYKHWFLKGHCIIQKHEFSEKQVKLREFYMLGK